jgi:ATP-dependent helicase/nuclease subunit B
MSASSHRRRVLSIPSGAPFLPAFVEALLAGRVIEGFPDKTDPMALASARIFVPTRRAARALASELARQVSASSIILPQIVPLGAMEDSETQALFDPELPEFERPDVVSEVERRLVLAELILKWSQNIRNAVVSYEDDRPVFDDSEPMLVTSSPAQAFHLAGELAALIDEMVIEDIDPSALKTLVTENFDKYWAITLTFLQIAFKAWPNHLEEKELEDRAHRQAALIKQEIDRLKSGRATGPQIVIGSTGTNTATADLIKAIASLPQGAVVLPGLDTTLDPASCAAIDGAVQDSKPAIMTAGHPQAAMRKLMRVIGITQQDVQEIGNVPPTRVARMQMLREALRPAQTTEHWYTWRKSQPSTYFEEALRNVAFIEAADEREEALAIAIALRGILETPGETAAFITPDRSLARRVRADLQRWQIDVDDSGGDPLTGEPAGILAALAIACTGPHAGAGDLLALLDHAHVRLGYEPARYARLRRHFEIAVLRGPGFSLDDLPQALDLAQTLAEDHHAHPAVKRIEADDWDDLEEFVDRIIKALSPLRAPPARRTPGEWLRALADTIAHLTLRSAEDAREPLGEDTVVLFDIINSFSSVDDSRFPLTRDDFASLFAVLAREAVVRGPRKVHPRIKILGLLEARLLTADNVVLGGLDETIWPPAAKADAYLNRPMRAQLGLSSPERRIGQTAHDFVEAAGAASLTITRARKRDGAPTVPSRLIQRIEALAGEAWKQCSQRGETLLQMARKLDEAKGSKSIAAPRPCPPLALRPQTLSITEIETWRRDPYSIYARHILGLLPLEDVNADTTHAEFGTQFHQVIADFQKKYPHGPLPEDAGKTLFEVATKEFTALLANHAFRVFRWPDVQLSLQKFITWENDRRSSLKSILTEAGGRLPIELADGSTFTLRGRADRIEETKDGLVNIIDFKTGKVPTKKEIAAGFAPQLTLEAAMIERGAFEDIGPKARIGQALYVRIGKGEEDKDIEVGTPEKPLEALAAEHYEELIKLANQFREEGTPYLARPMPQYASRYAEYDHLSRVKEWSEGGEDRS